MPRGRPKSKKNPSSEQIHSQIPPEKFVELFSKTMMDTLQMIHQHPSYTPFLSNQLMKDINVNPYKATSDEIKKWFEQPAQFEQQLNRLSQYLEGVVMQYERTIYHFATNLDFNYYTYPISPVPNPKEKPEEFKKYKKSKQKALDFLRKLRPKEQFFNITLGIMREGAKFYYLRESLEYIDYQELPSEWCYIDGRTSLGFTFAFSMAFFLRAPQSLSAYSSDFQKWFKDFYSEWEVNKNITYYKKMPPQNSNVFIFDDTKAAKLSPLRSLLKDSLDVVEYKQLLKTKTLLDTYKIIHLRVPLDKDSKPTMPYQLVSGYVAQSQSSLPYGAISFASPFDMQELKVSDNQFLNVLGSQINDQYWKSSGISPLAYGSDSGKSVGAIKSSNLVDSNFLDHIYNQFIKAVNYQLSLRTGTYKMGIKMFGDSFSRQETIDRYKDSVSFGVCRKEYLAALNKEPWEYETHMSDEDLYSWDTAQFIPFQTSFTQSGNQDGRKKVSDSKLGDAGSIVRDYDSNED